MNVWVNGALSPGIHDCTYEEFIRTFVDEFPTSQRRKLIADTLLSFASEIFSIGIPVEFWIDGSYVTGKINPNDADIVLFFQYQHMIAMQNRIGEYRKKYKGILDLYIAFAVCAENKGLLSADDYEQVINQRNYWRGQFGFDRADEPKGIVRLSCDSIVEQIERRK